MPLDISIKQQDIYNGIQKISPEAAELYMGALKLIQSDMPGKSNFIAHAAREIDSNLREILEDKEKKAKLQKNLSDEDLKLAYTAFQNKNKGLIYARDLDFEFFKEKKGNIASILVSLNEPINSVLGQEWIRISVLFHRYAHRDSIALIPKDPSDIVAIWNDYENNILARLIGSYFSKLDILTKLSTISSPSEVAKTILPNLLDTEAIQKDFFSQLKAPEWLAILMERKIFDPESAPAPEKIENGFTIRYWYPLMYLEYLSKEINQGKLLNLVPLILKIVEEVSERHKIERNLDNDRIWASFIQILVRVPNHLIPISLLDYIPVWLDTKWNLLYATSDLVREFLPKFLPDMPTEDDLEKADRILRHILNLRLIPYSHSELFKSHLKLKHAPVIYLHWLDNILQNGIGEKISKHCSDDLILYVSFKLYQALKDDQRIRYCPISTTAGKFWLVGELNYSDSGASISIHDGSIDISDETILAGINVASFGSYSSESFFSLLQNEFQFLSLTTADHTVIQEIDKFIYNFFEYDSSYGWTYSIKNYDDKYLGDEIKANYLNLLKIVLTETAKYQPSRVKPIIKEYLSAKFRTPLFRKLAIYLIGEQWDQFKDLFWSFVDETQSKIFSTYYLEGDLKQLLKDNSQKFTKNEEKIILQIIQQGPEQPMDLKYHDHWRLSWYAALRANETFTSIYEEFSKKLELTSDHFDRLGKSEVRIGHISPFTKEELLAKSNHEIVQRILEFQPTNRWDDPEIAGFSQMLGLAVAENPNQFVNELNLYCRIYLPYAYEIIRGLEEAWKIKRSFDWKKALEFCNQYISQPEFLNGQLIIDHDSWHTTPAWILGAIGNLITSGSQNDSNSFEDGLIPLANQILLKAIDQIPKENGPNESNINYPTYTLNSTAGKLIRSFLDITLKDARVKFTTNDTDQVKWTIKAREVFESCIENEVIDIYVMVGWYFPQFYFLDKEWILKMLDGFQDLEGQRWEAFMSGYMMNNPSGGIKIYEKMYRQYATAIELNMTFDYHGEPGIGKHLFHFFYWDYEDIGVENLTTKLIKFGSPDLIADLIQFIRKIEGRVYFKTVKEKNEFQRKIIAIWKLLLERFREKNEVKAKKLLSSLVHFLVFFDGLDTILLKLLADTSVFIKYGFDHYFLFGELNKIKSNGDLRLNADSIANIFLDLLQTSPPPDYDQKDIRSLIRFIYEQHNPSLKSKADAICNKYAELGNPFLRDIYDENLL